MNVERITQLAGRARLHAALSEPVRLAIIETLALGDASPGELAQALDITTNLLAHHVKILESEGLIRRTRSEADRRRSYLRLDTAALSGLQIGPAPRPTARIVFVCTANSARSQLAAALWAQASQVPATSAGTHPSAEIDPGALATARRHGLKLTATRPRSLADVSEASDLIITVCDNAHEELRLEHGLHWSVPDPVPSGKAADFDAAYDELDRRVLALAPQLHAS